MNHILGINAFHGDSAAALLRDGHLAAAVEEERFTRIKHWAGLPAQASAACLKMTGAGQVDHLAISRDPRAHFGRKLLRVATRPSAWRMAGNRVVNSARIARVKSDLIAAGVPGLENTEFHLVE